MNTLLHVTASLWGTQGQSSQLSQALVERWLARYPNARLIERDLTADPVPHLTGAAFAAGLKPVADRTSEEQGLAALGDSLIAEIESADTMVVGLPMYNFGVPSNLKAWFDHLARAGRTFRYTSAGPEGLLKGKRVFVVATRGGIHAGTPTDVQTGFVQTFLAFLGMTDVEFVYAEGLSLGDTRRQEARTMAQARIDALMATATDLEPVALAA